MNTDDRNLFRTLEPPPGGVERFRRRLGAVDAEARPMPGWRVLAAGLAAALIALVITVNWPPGGGGDLPGGSQTSPPMAGSAGMTATAVGGSEGTPAERAPHEATAIPEAMTVPGTIPEATMPSEATETRELAGLRGAPAFARLLGQPLRPTATRIAIDDMRVAVTELPSTNSKVRIYQVNNN